MGPNAMLWGGWHRNKSARIGTARYKGPLQQEGGAASSDLKQRQAPNCTALRNAKYDGTVEAPRHCAGLYAAALYGL